MGKNIVGIITGLIFAVFCIPPAFSFDTGRDEPPVMFNIFSTKFSASTPFWVKIGDTKYYLFHDKKSGTYTNLDVVGCEGKKDRLFEPFYTLDTNQDMKITAKELKAGGIRFVAVKMNGKFDLYDRENDFPVDNIEYIDIFTAATYSDRITRPFGTFNMYVKTESGNTRKYIGHVGYIWPRRLERMF